MQKTKKKKSIGEMEYWQPTSDLLISLILVLLLIVSLLVLYLLNIPDFVLSDPEPGDSASDEIYETEGKDEENTNHLEDHLYDHDNDDEGHQQDITVSGGGGEDGDGDEPGNDEGDGMKSAVFVMLIDGDTHKTVKEAGVTFELYSEDNGLQILNTYFPEKLTFKNYFTRDDGTYYLPEKIFQDTYYFRQLTEIDGYDRADDTHFVLNDVYDWPEPFLVEIPVYPSRNIIRIQMSDQDTNIGVAGGTFDIIAAEDIITEDGTLRYAEGQVVDTIACDETGYGESAELYLGSYVIRQNSIPQFYAAWENALETSVEKKTDIESGINEILTEKTRVTLRLTDELYTEQGIQGVSFSIEADNGQTRMEQTDVNGVITISDLEKNTRYRITQLDAADHYSFTQTPTIVTVDGKGEVDHKAHGELSLTNRILRVSIDLRAAIIEQHVTDVNMSLFNEANDEVLHTWTATGAPITFQDLTEGQYYVIVDGKTERPYPITVTNTADIQSVEITVLTWQSIAVLGLVFLVGTGIVTGCVTGCGKLLAKRHKRQEGAADS